jgi:hypothetical protein
MVDKPAPVAKATISSQVDAQGYVTVYDHGPQPPADDAAQPVKDAAAADLKAWDALHGDEPVALRMPAADAAHAVEADPTRYGLEPLDLDESAVTAKMAEIRTKREAAVKAKEDAADRQTAIGLVVSDKVNARAAKVAADAAKPKTAQRPHHVPPVTPAPAATPKT